MQIASAASAFPPHYYPQETLLAAFQAYWGDKLENPRVLNHFHRGVGVDGRHLAMPMEKYLDLDTWGKANNVWIDVAVDLGEQALRTAASRAGIDPAQLGALFFVSISGVASPSIDARLINRMTLSPRIRRVPIFGLGCVAGAAGIARAADYVKAYPSQYAALVSVETCSLTLQRDDLSVANIISSGLFGDGAAAVILAGADCPPAPGPRILATRSVFFPNTEHVMGWDVSEKGFQIILTREVPEMVRQHLAVELDAFLADLQLSRAEVGSWILHTGGPAVLEATESSLGLQNGELQVSWDCLRKQGNLSSASVLCVLEEVMEHRRPAPGTLSVLAAMGPGFCSELVLLRW